MLKMKEEEHKERGFPFDGVINLWDWRYYTRIKKEK